MRPALREARDVQEHFVDVGADRGVGGEQAEVGVEARRARMVVAGAEVRVGHEARTRPRASRSRRMSSASFACVLRPNTP